jgi:Calcineurin-like phosphoesterase
MTAPAPSKARRTTFALGALASAAVGVLLAATWAIGSSAWPPSETTVARRLGTDPAAIEKAVAQGDPSKPLRIAVLGDIQNGISELGDVLAAHRAAGVDFILQLGDAANKGLPGRYSVLRRVFEEHAPGIPVIAVPGNHDIEPDGTTVNWAEWVGPPEWRMDVRGWRIVGIDDSDGPISAASMDLLRAVAKDTPPRCGTILVAHRPLSRTDGAPGNDTVDARAKQIASTGLVATMTFSGHWHRNDTTPDAAGTIHYLLGENCDRSSAGDDPSVSKAVLTLETSPADGKSAGHRLDVDRIPRRVRVSDEFLRTAVGSFYPWLREHAWALWTSLLAAGLAAALFARAALRRVAPSGS